MNKVISSALIVLSFLAAILLTISTLFTSEKSLKLLLNFKKDLYIDFVLNDSHWHPYKPSIEIETLSIKRAELETMFIEIEGLKIEFNLLAPFQGNFIETFYAEDMRLVIYTSENQSQANANDL